MALKRRQCYSQPECKTPLVSAPSLAGPPFPAGRTSEHERQLPKHTVAATMLSNLAKLDWDFADANTGHLTHALHPYPAKFIPQIPQALIQELSSVGDTVLDMFCGSGTTLLEALRLGRNAVGIDANPLAALISRVKTTPLAAAEFDELEEHRAVCERILAEAALASGGCSAMVDHFGPPVGVRHPKCVSSGSNPMLWRSWRHCESRQIK